MRLGIAADSAGITCFLDAFDECMKRVDLHLVTQKNSFQEFIGSPLQQTVPGKLKVIFGLHTIYTPPGNLCR